MKRSLVGIVTCLAVLACANSATAAFHLWKFVEFFSNADGTVQFIEMMDPGPFEDQTNGAQIQSLSTGKTFTFPMLGSDDTAGKSLLIATPNFAAVSGVTPDYELEPQFLNPAGDTISFVNLFTYDSRTYTSIPTDGTQSRNYVYGVAGDGTLAPNMPKNFNGDVGMVNLASPTGDYNGNHTVDAADYTLWRDTFGKSVTKGTEADGNNDSTINDADFTFWKNNFNNPAGAGGGGLMGGTVPEPATLVLLLAALTGLAATGRHVRRLLR